jgi:hypothetical protein
MFNVGDKVIVNESCSKHYYGWTNSKSTGVVTHVNSNSIRVKFDYCSGDPDNEYGPHHYWFNRLDHFTITEGLFLIKPDDPNYKYAKIIYKIRQLDKKFKDRKVSYELNPF